MKYIFTIHSPITYFCAANIVLAEGLQKENVIFLYTSFVPPDDLGLPVPSFYTMHKSVFKKLMTFNLVKAYDKYVNKITNGNQFQAYIDLAHYYQKILITHSNCTAFHFIEEGMSSYIPPQTLSDLTRIESSTSFRFKGYKEKLRAILRILRGYNLRLLALPYFANSFTFLSDSKYYGFSPAVYPGVLTENKIIIEAQTIHLSKKKITSEIDLSNAILLIEESYFKVYKIDEKDLDYCMNQSMTILKRKIASRPVYVKLRPGQKEHNSIWIRYLSKNQLTYKVLSGDLILEELLIDSEGCNVVGTVSALLFYSSIFGHNAFSNYTLFSQKPKAVFDYLDFYWERVANLSKLDDKIFN